MSFQFDPLVRRDFSGCDVLWFSGNPGFVVGTFVEGLHVVSSSGTWLQTGRWLYSDGSKNDVITCSWNKTIDGSQPGVCSFQLKKGRDWFNLIRPGDALVVFMSSTLGGLQQKTSLVSIVFVDTVEDAVYVDQLGATLSVVSVSARDITKVFQEYSTAFDPNLGQVRENLFYTAKWLELWNRDISKDKGLSPVEVVLFLLDAMFNGVKTDSHSVTFQWRFPGNETIPVISLLDVSTFVQVPLYGFCIGHTPDWVGAGNVGNLLSAYANGSVNEMFFDIRDLDKASLASMAYQEAAARPFVTQSDAHVQDVTRGAVQTAFLRLGQGFTGQRTETHDAIDTGAPTDVIANVKTTTVAMVFRQRPYDTGAFLALPANIVLETELIQSTLGRSVHGVENYFHLTLAGFDALQQEMTYGIVVNPTSISRFGLRRRDLETRYFLSSSEGAWGWEPEDASFQDLSGPYRYYVPLVATWNAYNDRFLEGTLVLHFRPDIRVGTRLEVQYSATATCPARVYQFYVEGVRHNFAYDAGRSQTILTVVRGFDQVDSLHTLEANLYWTWDGLWNLLVDPYELFDGGFFHKKTSLPTSKSQSLGDRPSPTSKVQTPGEQPPTNPLVPSSQGSVLQGSITGYWPYKPNLSPAELNEEGGQHDMYGHPIITLEMHQTDPVRFPYVSVSADFHIFPRGQRLEFSGWPGLIFRRVDSGSHFHDALKVYRTPGFEPFDVAVASPATVVPRHQTVTVVPGDSFVHQDVNYALLDGYNVPYTKVV